MASYLDHLRQEIKILEDRLAALKQQEMEESIREEDHQQSLLQESQGRLFWTMKEMKS